MDATVIYYTSNREDGPFEAKIRAKLLETIGDLPLISVSQQPMDFGENICVGDVGTSSHNAHRQFQIGAMAAKTKYVIAAEADFLYPKDYFTFTPPRDDRAYRSDNVWILWPRGKYHKKAYSEGATIVGREYLIDMVERSLTGRPQWQSDIERPEDTAVTFKQSGFDFFHTGPIVTFKTRRGMHMKSPFSKENKTQVLELWGDVTQLKKDYGII